jgi:hypothetical protein
VPAGSTIITITTTTSSRRKPTDLLRPWANWKHPYHEAALRVRQDPQAVAGPKRPLAR